ncbi:hypothetical protein DFH07DRAFT_960214 [Mycena maculata]|uniref:Pentatricopeptide repeat-containing protein n=1 Tax=Mycena maculata TaxID=230809 RepID=A0AAD7NAA0_9AGAR|nr:hypothetical protein DFH07DRAFT_960214 [Mycena maculata]
MTHLLRTRGVRLIPPLLSPPRKLFCASFNTQRSQIEPLDPDSDRKALSLESRNRSLVDYVEREHFWAAERLRLHLISELAPIDPNPAYERAALAQITFHGRQDLKAFLTWLDLVPDNKVPWRVERGPLTKTRNLLFRTGNPSRNLQLIKEFSLVCAAKGYGRLVWDDLILLMTRFEHAEEATVFFLKYEVALRRYYVRYHPGLVEETANRQRYLLVMWCCNVGWLREAVKLVQNSADYNITQACRWLIDLLRVQNDTEGIALVEECLSRRRNRPDTQTEPALSTKMTTAQRFSDIFTRSSEPSTVIQTHPRSPTPFHSTRSIIEGSGTLRPRSWIASRLKEVKCLLSRRSLVSFRPPGSDLHSFIAHYDVCKAHPRGLFILRKRALTASDPSSHTWLCKEMFYLHESRKFADIVALFGANFRTAFLPPKPWRAIRELADPLADQSRTLHIVPTRLDINRADAWVIWNAIVRLAVHLPAPLPVLDALRFSVVHYSATLTGRQFRAFPTSFTAVLRSLIWAYGEAGAVDRAAAVAGDVSLIGQMHLSNVGLLDELAGVYARTGDVAAATRLLGSLEEMMPRLATYGVMMDAYLQAGFVQEAFELEARMKQKCHYVPGANWRMDATLRALRAAEDALDPEVYIAF